MKIRFQRSFFSIPYFVIVLIFVIFPLLILLFFAFQNGDGGFTFKNFATFLDISSLRILGQSMLIALITTIICLVVSLPIALILSNTKLNKSAVLVMLFIVPMLINSVLRTYAMDSAFTMIGLKNNYVKVVIAMVADYLPFMLMPIYTSLVSMDKSLIEASTDLGANSFSTLMKIKMPLAVPGIVSGILMVFMPTVSSFAISDIVSQKQVYLFGSMINSYFERNNYNTGSALAFILLIIIALTMFIANKVTNGKADVSAGGRGL